MGDAQGPGLDASFDSKEDYEMYMKLMSERRRIQQQLEEKKRKKKQLSSKKLEERERGFQVHFSGANGERLDEARRREQRSQEERRSQPLAAKGGASRSKEWQMATVELRGTDGQVFRTSPTMAGGDALANERRDGSDEDDAICEELPRSRAESPSACVTDEGEASSSRPGSSGSRVDQETRGVLRVMETANRDELLQLRESLSKQIERRVAGASPMSRVRATTSGRSSTRLLLDPERSRPSSAANENPSRPSSSSSAIAEAIQAENARVKARHSAAEAGADSVEALPMDASSGSRPSSRSSSKAGRRLPLSAEAALESAPPSVLSGSAPTRRPPTGQSLAPNAPHAAAASLGASAGYPNAWGSNPQAPAAGEQVSPTRSPAPSNQRPPLAAGYTPAASSAPPAAAATAEGSSDIIDRVGRLDRRKQKALLRVIDSLEAEKSTSLSPPKATAVDGAASVAMRVEDPSASSPSRDMAQPVLGASALRLRVLSNWGAARQCGLSLIEALDRSGEALRIPPAFLSLHGTQSGSTTLPRVVEGVPQATADKAMWVATVCQSRSEGAGAFEPFELVLNWPEGSTPPAALKLWNFNSPDGLPKGVREAEVWRDSVRIWAEQVPIGSGTAAHTPALVILDPSFRQPAGAITSVVGSGVEDGKERPMWLDGKARIGPLHEEASSWDPTPTLAGPMAQAMRKPDPGVDSLKPPGQGDREREFEMSIRALEEFRSSQSRRFFSHRSKSEEDLAQAEPKLRGADFAHSAEDWRAPVGGNPNRLAVPGASPNPVPQRADAMGASYTADFGGKPSRAAKLGAEIPAAGAQSFAIEGIGEIPVIDFEGGDADALDGLVDDRPCLMGSSIVADRLDDPMASVVIPTMPRGRTLVFNCVSTWGDQNFVGLSGVEIFDGRGAPVVLKDVARQVTADPSSINILPEYEHDPRTVDKLFDQVNLTKDDFHVWLAPFFPGRSHTVTVDLERTTSVSMIRVWNYNKSRLHSSRGVKDLEILLDGVPIFVGEVQRAPGLLTIPDQACEHILFTQDEGVLQVIEEHDWLPDHLPLEDDGAGEGEYSLAADDLDRALRELAAERPLTADVDARHGLSAASPRGSSATGADGRPITRASDRQTARGTFCGIVTLVIHSTWGDAFYVGLTAIEVLDASLQPILLQPGQIDASPRDLNDLEGVEEDPRIIDNLMDEVTCTTDDHHMWLAPFQKAPLQADKVAVSGQECMRNLIRIDFGGERQEVAGFNIWNYNKNAEDTCRGVKEFSVYCDEKYIATFLCRKAPGHVHFDFKQVILLEQPPSMDANARRAVMQGLPPVAPRLPSRGRSDRQRTSSRDGRAPRPSSRERSASRGPADFGPSSASEGARVQQQYETPLHPCGFVFRLVLLSSWSDTHYIGLDGIELYNLEGRLVRPRRVHSNHGSVRNLPNMENDIRIETNLLEGAPGSSGRMWLAPYVRQPPNSVELVFDEPTQISCVHFWNYSRTPARGARDIEFYVDDLLVYQGILRQEDASRPSSRSGGSGKGEAVLFTQLPEIVARERGFVYIPSAEELITFFDETGCVDKLHGHSAGLPTERPMTALTQ